jgi:GDPmannose 4,6-dehydratase
MSKVAFITGITGQDGSYLAEFLLEKGYTIFGLVRRSSSINTKRIDHIYSKLQLRYGDLSDAISVTKILTEIKNTK